MSEDNKWIKEFLDSKDIAELESKAQRIVEAQGVYYQMSVMMSQEDMINAVRAGYGMKVGDTEAWMLGVAVLMSLLGTMEDALEEDGIDIFEE